MDSIDQLIDKDSFFSNEEEVILSNKLEKLKVAMNQISRIEQDLLINKYLNFKKY